MAEQITKTAGIPSGYESSEGLEQRAIVDGNILPWLDQPQELAVSRCTLQSGETFLLASAVGTNPKLVEAANGMTDKQRQNADNMFYSRIPTVVSKGYSPNVDTISSPVTDFPIHVMRNQGGQRVYFARVSLGLPEEQTYGPTIVRLAVCDKNKQVVAATALSSASDGTNRMRRSRAN